MKRIGRFLRAVWRDTREFVYTLLGTLAFAVAMVGAIVFVSTNDTAAAVVKWSLILIGVPATVLLLLFLALCLAGYLWTTWKRAGR